jgi:uncharacterized protein CbrC (UPF0167 family)
MANLLGHKVLITWTEIQHQEDMNKCLRNAVKGSQWPAQIRNGHIKIMPKKNL